MFAILGTMRKVEWRCEAVDDSNVLPHFWRFAM